jgi:epoxyqueuosine reductase
MLSSIMDGFANELLSCLRELGLQMKVVSVSHLHELQEEIEGLCSQGFLEKQFYEDRLTWFSFQAPSDFSEARSLIVVAAPRPQTRAIFGWNGESRPLIIPPTYTAYDVITKRIGNLLGEMIGERGYRLVEASLPLKLLAARSGLSEYGKNNICYVPGLGSFLQLAAYFSDMPCEEDTWQEASMMKSCNGCDLCQLACPTVAINKGRFLLHAERCVSYHNEKKGDVGFPSWMDTSSHNCVVGCMRCQKVCPQNKDFIEWIGDEERFTEEETNLLLEHPSGEKLPAETLKKLETLDLIDYLDCLPRNLAVFFKRAPLR